MSDIQGAKAISLVQEDKVRELEHVRVFQIPSSSGERTYTVVVSARGDSCTCEAAHHGRRCYHTRAAHLYMAKQRQALAVEPADDALWKRVGA